MTRNATVGAPVRMALRQAQQGVVLFIALIVLVAMTMAGIAVMRSVDTNVLIAGNLAFRNAALSAADAGIESGRNWLAAQSGGALINDTLPGYYANWQDSFNPATFDWATNGLLVGSDSNGNEIRYIVHRMCAEWYRLLQDRQHKFGQHQRWQLLRTDTAGRFRPALLPHHRARGRTTQHGELCASVCLLRS
jgi:hypothetical protein